MNDQGTKQRKMGEEVVAATMTAIDVTERKQVATALLQERNRAQQYLDVAAVIMVVLDKDGKITLLNQRGCEILQYPAETLLGKNWFDTCVPKRVRNEVQVTFRQLMAGQLEPVEYFENPVVIRSGEERIIAWHNALLTDKEGQITGTLSSGMDITERKRTEQARHQAHAELERRVEERTAELTKANEALAVFRRFVEASTQGFTLANLNGELTYVNPAVSRLIADGRSEDVIGTHFSKYYPKDYMQRREKEILPSILRDGHWQGEVVFSIRGESIVVLQSSFLVRDEQGNPAYLATVLTDITERKLAEEALRQSHDELRVIYDGMVDGLLVTDIETMQFVRANASICRMLGYSKTELQSLSVQDIHPAESLPYVLENIRSAEEANHTRTGDIPVLRKDGSVFYAEVIGKFLVYNGRPCSMGIFRDITERRQAEEALRQSEEKYRGLLEASPDAVVMTDLNGKILFASRQAWELAGLSDSEDWVGRSVFDYIIEGDRRRAAENFSRLAATGGRRNIEYTALRQDGTTTPTEISSALSRDAQGQPIAVMAVIRDITERKRTLEQLEKEHRTLKYLLQSSDHERQLIAYEIHDELAQQLAGAIMQFQTFEHLKETRPKEAAKAYDAGMTMLQQGHFETRRLIAGVRPPILDEDGVVAAVGHLVNEQSRLKGPKIDYHNSVDFDRLAPILENGIYRIAQEGLANACQHSKSEKVRVSLVQREDRVHIDIRDWGIGFDARAVHENRFGLEGIRQRARLLGGKCSIRSKTGKGTRIVVELPVVERE